MTAFGGERKEGRGRPAGARAGGRGGTGWRPGRAGAVVLVSAVLMAPALAVGEAWGEAGLEAARLVDLTHPFDERTIYWPTEKGFALERGHAGPTDRLPYYAANRFRAPEHGGTHVDAPAHFARGGLTVDRLPLASLVGPAVVIDISERSARDADALLEPSDVLAWEERHGRVPKGAIALLRSGWSARWPDRRRVLGSDRPGDVEHLHFPGFSVEAARLLVRERGAGALGVDTPSMDYGPSLDFPVHRLLAETGRPGLENLAGLERLPEAGATILALPMKIAGGTGAPARVIAILPE